MNENAAMIRDFVSCKAEALEGAAERYKVSLPSAKAIRNHWIPRLSGRCVNCHGFVKKGKCSKCGSDANPVEKTLEVLVKIHPGSPLIRRQCWKCKRTFMYRAGFVLEKFKEHGAFVPASMCNGCKEEERIRKEEERIKNLPPKKKTTKKIAEKNPDRQIKVNRVPKEKKSPPKEDPKKVVAGRDLPDGLRHSPFKALKILKVQKQ